MRDHQQKEKSPNIIKINMMEKIAYIWLESFKISRPRLQRKYSLEEEIYTKIMWEM